MSVESGTTLDQAGAAKILHSIASGHLIEGDVPAALTGYAAGTPADGLQLQLAVLDLWRQAGEEIGGWKVAFTSRGKRDDMGEGFRPFGYVLASRIVPSGGTIPAGEIPGCVLEAELCVTLGQRFGGPDVTAEDAHKAVSSISAAFEICSRRLPGGMPPAVRVGNSMNNWGIVTGPEHAPDVDPASLTVELFADGKSVGSSSAGPDILDDPWQSLARAARLLDESGLAFEAGQRVIVGSILPGHLVGEGKHFEATFGELGSVVVNCA
jgi:2-keto-4-pentenoate hydratase